MDEPITLGKRYRDDTTGVSGTATALVTYLHGCERVCLEYVAEGKVVADYFDAPRLALNE